MAAFHHYQPTAFELDESTHQAPIASGSGHQPSSEPSGSATDSQPVTPLRRVRDPNIDPALYTPSKRMRMMTSALAGTTSGSFLITKAPVTSRSSIAAPVIEQPPEMDLPNRNLIDDNQPENIEHLSAAALRARVAELTSALTVSRQHLAAREGIIEAANAQLIIQNIFVGKQSEALHAKEQKKSKKRGKVKGTEDGQCRHMTATEYIEALEKEERERADEDAARATRAQARKDKKTAKAELEERWKQLKLEHRAAVERWEERCAALTAGGTRKKDLPKKPKCTKKPELPKDDANEDNSDSSDSD
ncbi:hypothetical protein B0H15DRAFT_793183 [Mycena belliarum]|uniref:Uncharacterized protein n=1 Tax=Mycena belliarum TaxID=1033014 RepID=A0AAD6TMB2_9AGAR|nr:hypothetical protein B0H15DRAFT_793183 [Mycena belliae]